MQESNPLFFMKVRVDECLGDIPMSLLSDQQFGWLCRLTLWAWKGQGVLENSDDVLFRFSGATSREVWEEKKNAVLAFFDEGVDADSLSVLIHRRLFDQWVLANEHNEQRKDAARKSAEARALRKQQAEIQAEAA